MGGAGPDPNARGGRRSLDAALNLVPYVDILMTLMVFLVMCAVFTQMAVLTVESKSGAVAGLPPDPAEHEVPAIEVRVTATTIAIERDGRRIDVPRAPLEVAQLERALREVSTGGPACTVRADDGVRMLDIVQVLDVARGVGVTGVALEPAAG